MSKESIDTATNQLILFVSQSNIGRQLFENVRSELSSVIDLVYVESIDLVMQRLHDPRLIGIVTTARLQGRLAKGDKNLITFHEKGIDVQSESQLIVREVREIIDALAITVLRSNLIQTGPYTLNLSNRDLTLASGKVIKISMNRDRYANDPLLLLEYFMYHPDIDVCVDDLMQIMTVYKIQPAAIRACLTSLVKQGAPLQHLVGSQFWRLNISGNTNLYLSPEHRAILTIMHNSQGQQFNSTVLIKALKEIGYTVTLGNINLLLEKFKEEPFCNFFRLGGSTHNGCSIIGEVPKQYLLKPTNPNVAGEGVVKVLTPVFIDHPLTFGVTNSEIGQCVRLFPIGAQPSARAFLENLSQNLATVIGLSKSLIQMNIASQKDGSLHLSLVDRIQEEYNDLDDEDKTKIRTMFDDTAKELSKQGIIITLMEPVCI